MASRHVRAAAGARSRGSATAEVYVPLYHAPGEVYQLDWSHEVALIAGVRISAANIGPNLFHQKRTVS